MTSTPEDRPVPTVADKYMPLFDLGQGGMGNVVLAVIRGPGGFNKLQVVKSLRQELADNPEFLTMFLDEARLSARINHANVVQTNEVGFDGASYFIAMEYLEGQSLEAYLIRAAKRGPLPIHLCLHVLVDACAGLHHAHELVDFDGRALHVVHRDVSPHNIFVTYDGQTKVLDFGIAKAADSSSQTRTGIIKGKVAYMAPEQFKSGAADRRADVFALGAILWRIIAGRRLWKNMTDMEVFQKLADAEIPSPLEENKDAPPELVAICMKALAVNPDDRYATAAELQTALEEFLETYPQKASARSIGKDVSELFADRRKSIKTAIETRLASGVPSQVSVVPQLPISSPDLSDGAGERAAAARSAAVGDGGTSIIPGNVSGSHATAPSRGVVPAPTPVAPSSARTLLLVLAAALSIIAALLVVIRSRSSSNLPPPASVVAVGIETDPTEAIVKLDDRVIEHAVSVPRDSAMHKLTVEAVGYKPHSQMVDLTASTLNLHVALESAAEPTKPGPSAAPPPPATVAAPVRGKWQPKPPPTAAKPATDPAPAPAPAPPAPAPAPEKNGLDPGDPWGKKK